MKNEMKLSFLSVSENEKFARATVAAFVTQLDPTLDELNDIKTVVSEAVTNSIIHGYKEKDDQFITIHCLLYESQFELTIIDNGVGIENIDEAREPLYTSKPELERSGMGFTIMESFMDHVDIKSSINEGTTVSMKKQLSSAKTVCN